jgi:hypothetical protein
MTNPQPQPDAVTDAETRVQAYLDKVQSFVKHDYACELLDEPGYFATLDYGDLRALLASLATLRGERDALLADKARLDWLDTQRSINIFTPSRKPDNASNAGWAWYGPHETKGELAVNAPDIRALLDAARAPQGRTE